MRENFDACNIELWYNDALRRYQAVGIGNETFCIHVLSVIKENNFFSSHPAVNYENEDPAQFLNKVKRRIQGKKAIEEATRTIIAVFSKDDEAEVRENLILKQLNSEERASAQAMLESLKTLNEVNLESE